MRARIRLRRQLPALLLGAALGDPAQSAVFTVSTTADAGPGSLRQAMLDANANGGVFDTIRFDIAGAGVQTIALQTELPELTHPVLIDGFTQPGSAPNTANAGSNAVLRIVLDGSAIPVDFSDPANPVFSTGIRLRTVASTLRGLVLHGFSIQVSIDGAGNAVEGCYLGTDAAGQSDAHPLDVVGVFLFGGNDNRIGGAAPAQRNLVSAMFDGIADGGSTANFTRIEGNLIGTDAGGSAALPNQGVGVAASNSDGWTVGGLAEGAGNTIASNGGDAIRIGQNATQVQILGNTIRDNGGLGINHIVNSTGFGGVTPNRVDDSGIPTNFPVLASATIVDGGILLDGTLDRPAGTQPVTYRIAAYASPDCDASGHGEGAQPLGHALVTFPDGASEGFELLLAASAPAGSAISATAARADGTTSEFSACVPLFDAVTVFNDDFEDK